MKILKIVPNEFVNASRDLREISTLNSLGCKVVVLAKESSLHFTYDGISIIRLKSRPLGKMFKSISLNRLVSLFIWAKTARKENADILSCHDIICLFIGWMSTWFTSKKPFLVYDSHEFEYVRNVKRTRMGKLFIKHAESFLMKRCAFSMMVNDSIASEVMKLHHLKERPVVVRNIPDFGDVDMEIIKDMKVSFKNEHHIQDTESLILYQGGVVPGRGIEKAIEALSYIENARLIVLGGGENDYINSLQLQAKSIKVDDRLIFIPAVPHDQLWKYTGIADVGLCNIDNVCLSYYYSLPNKLFEYIQALVPVVGSDFPEIKGIIDKYRVGEICNPNDSQSIANAIKEVVSKSRREGYLENLLSAKMELSWHNESKVLAAAYMQLINQRLGQNAH